jgi:hypothetical protein
MLFATNNVERMRIDSNGNIGIGTSPATPLNVIVTTNGGILTQDPTNASKNSLEIRLRDTNTGANYIRCDQYGDVYNPGSYQATRFIIRQSGNVGIGTATPAGTLHVNGTIINKTYDMGTISATNTITLDLSLGTIFTLNYTNGSYIILTCTNAPVSGSQTVTIYVKSNAAVQFAGAGSNVVWGTPGVPTLTLNKVDCFEISYVPAFGGGSAQYYAFRKGYGY